MVMDGHSAKYIMYQPEDSKETAVMLQPPLIGC